MKRLYCDICGKEIISKLITINDVKECDYSVYLNDQFGKHLLDLCESCSNTLTKLILEEKNNE